MNLIRLSVMVCIFMILPFTVKAESAPEVCNPNYPQDLCVPIPYTEKELSKVWDSKASNQYGGSGRVTDQGIKKLEKDCPPLCSKHKATWNIGTYTTSFDKNGKVSFSCSCRVK